MTADDASAIEYLCSTNVSNDQGETLHVWATPELLVVDRLRPKKGLTKASTERVREIPLEQVVSIEVDAISGAGHKYGWKPTTGFLNSGTKIPPISGVLVVLADGEHILWRVPYKAPIEVKADFGRLMSRVRDAQTEN